ncbi:MAG: RagB/SusD family nutrient uptake outer membrane protein [Bacteroidales bacterium]|nr:RagB/SusD family nutrient uptake outer membrane protein [Bacteroidales bacterium]
MKLIYNIIRKALALLALPLMGGVGGGLFSCSDFLKEYSQDMIVAKLPSDLDEVMLGSGYIGSSAISSGPTGTRMGGFFNVLDDDVNTGGDRINPETGKGSKEVTKAWGQVVLSNYGYFAWQQDVGVNYDGSLSSDDAATWDELYARINVVNTILDEIRDLPHETDKDRDDWYRVQGEACFLRAQFYFTLVNLYGNEYTPATAASSLGVPLKLQPGIEHEFTRATVAEVYDQITADLTVAEEYLTRSPQKTDHMLHRASLEAVDLLWSRVLLHQQRYELAAEKARCVMKSENFYLAPISALTPSTPFLTAENPEVIFSQGSNNLAPNEVFTARNGDYCVTRELYDLYTEGDARRDCFLGVYGESSGVDCDSVFLKNKYERGNSLRAHISDYYMLRLSEAYLNGAEALALLAMEQGRAEAEAEANALLNELRSQRIAAYEPTHYSGAELVQQVRDERRRELCFEGHRWFDLRRYAACTVCPYSRDIVHSFGVCGDYVGIMYRRTIVLPAGDMNYTFAIPKSVLKFFTDKPFDTNPRNAIEPIESEDNEE